MQTTCILLIHFICNYFLTVLCSSQFQRAVVHPPLLLFLESACRSSETLPCCMVRVLLLELIRFRFVRLDTTVFLFPLDVTALVAFAIAANAYKRFSNGRNISRFGLNQIRMSERYRTAWITNYLPRHTTWGLIHTIPASYKGWGSIHCFATINHDHSDSASIPSLIDTCFFIRSLQLQPPKWNSHSFLSMSLFCFPQYQELS